MNSCYVIKCQCCGECMTSNEGNNLWICAACGYKEQTILPAFAPRSTQKPSSVLNSINGGYKVQNSPPIHRKTEN